MYDRRLTIIIALLCLCSFSVVQAADHLDAPALQAGGMGPLDVNDLYAFQSPTNPDNSVLIMTVNPLAGMLSPTTFGTTDVVYEFQIDNTGDAIPDVTYAATFAPNGGGQEITLARDNTIIATGSTGTVLPTSGGGMVQAGVFDDPFFFDLAGFQNGLMFTGDDFFAGANVSAIVLEVPSSELGGPNIGISARTMFEGNQIDRMGRPAINTVLIPSSRKDEFNQGVPADDPANFGDAVRASIESLNGGDAAHAAAVTDILLPDLLTFDTSSSMGFLNGRQLADDVIDAELTLLTNSPTPIGDGVDMNDVPFRDSFPYLAVPEPSGIALAWITLAAIYGAARRRGN